MGFSLFKKKNKDKAPAPLPVNSLSIPPQRPTASPQHLRAPSTPSIAGTPRSSSTPSGTPRFSGTPSALNSPALSVNEWGQVPSISTGRRIKLRCLLDPLANTTGKQKEDVNNKGEALKELFYITAELDAPVETLRHQIEHELAVEGLYNIGIFKASKVSIPWAAHYQAKTYSQRYALPTHLISHFPSYNLDDPSQLNRSYGLQTATQHLMKPDNVDQGRIVETTVEDWWPEGIDNKDGVISVLVRLGEAEKSAGDSPPPLTLQVYFANQQAHQAVQPVSPVSGDFEGSLSEKEAPYPPLAIEVSRHATITELKEAIMTADGRPVGLLDKIKLWKVRLTWKEIMDCEALGEGKQGSMPWPYAVNAPEATPLQDMTLSMDAIFPAHKSNANFVSIFVWVHPTALGVLTRSRDLTLSILGEVIPNFQYPMKIRRHTSKAERQAMIEKNKVRDLSNLQFEEATGSWQRRPSLARAGRPVTAPSSAASSPGGSPVLSAVPSGKKGILKRSSSGFAMSHSHSLSADFGPTAVSTRVARPVSWYQSSTGSASSSNVTSPFSSDSEDSSGVRSVPQTPLTSTFDLRVDYITAALPPPPSKTVRWSQDISLIQKKSSDFRTVTIMESSETDSIESDLAQASVA